MAWRVVAAGQAAGHLVHDLGDAGEHLVHRQPVTDQPVEHTATSMGPVSVPQSDSAAATASAVAWVSQITAAGPVQALAPPEFRITAPQPAGGQHLLAPQHGAALTWLG